MAPMVGIGIDIWTGIIKPGGAAATLPLDSIGVASTGAYATCKLRAAYAGQCMRVRRSSDDAESDIGFSGSDLDTASLLAFTGSSSGFMVKLYDQSGNGFDLASLSFQPLVQARIVNAGVLEVVNSKAAIKFDATDDNMSNVAMQSIITDNTNYTAIAFARALSGSNVLGSFDCRGIWGDSARDLWMSFKDDGGANHFFAYGNQNDSNIVTITTTYPVEGIYTGRTTGGNVRATRNGGAEAVHTTTATTTGIGLKFGMTAIGGPSQIMDGWIAMLIFFPSALSLANLNLICPILATYYGQTWTTAT